MKFLYVGAVLVVVGLTFGCTSDDTGQSVAGKHRIDQIERDAEVEKMNAIQGVMDYTTYCLKGKKIVRIQNSFFYELDDNGKTIPCQ
jgi:hypothetical protein